MIKAILFDLDGTLLNTLKDLNEATNFTLKSFDLPPITIEQTRNFIGNGVKILLKIFDYNNIYAWYIIYQYNYI